MKYLIRNDYLDKIIELQNTPDIKVITGMRRSGKSILLNEFIDYVLKNDSKANVIFINLQELEFEELLEYHNLHKYVLDKYKDGLHNVLIIDEAHHLTRKQLQQILQYEKIYEPKIIISYDPQHYFNGSEIIDEVEKHVKLTRFELKVIIRYNKEIHTFINCLFDMSYESMYTNFKHISVQYFSNRKDAHEYLSSLREQSWKVINVVNDLKREKLTISNDIIGQEYDNVAALIDDHFYYKPNLRLACYGIDTTYEQPTKILFQSLTRTRRKLVLVIVDNEPVLKNVLSVLNQNS